MLDFISTCGAVKEVDISGDASQDLYATIDIGGGNISPTQSVTIQYPVLSVTNISNSVSSVSPGDTFTRTVEITNGGFGDAYVIILHDQYESGILSISNPSQGALTTTTDVAAGQDRAEIVIDLGGTPLGKDQTLTVTYDVELVSCDTNPPYISQIKAGYACTTSGEVCSFSDIIDTSVNASTQSLPEISVTFPEVDDNGNSVYGDGCWGDNIIRTAVITNNGSGEATNFELSVHATAASGQIAGGKGTSIDPNSFIIVETGEILTASDLIVNTEDLSTGSCYSTPGSRINGATIAIPSIPAGASITIQWEREICPLVGECDDKVLTISGLAAKYSYSDACGSAELGIPGYQEQHTVEYLINRFGSAVEGPLDLNDGETGTYEFPLQLVSSGLIDYLPQGARVQYNINLPEGLNYCGNNSVQIINEFGNTVSNATPDEIDNSDPRNVKVFFTPSTFAFLRSDQYLQIDVCADCSAGGGTKEMEISWAIDYTQVSPSCTNTAFPEEKYNCVTRAVTVHCPDCTLPEYLSISSFTSERITLGNADADNDYVDDGMPIDPTNADLKDAVSGDQIKFTAIGTASTPDGLPNSYMDLTFSGVSSNFMEGWTFISGTVTINGTQYALNSPTRNGNIDTFDFSSFGGLNDGNTIEFEAIYNQLYEGPETDGINNINNQQLVTKGFMYGSNAPNPEGNYTDSPQPENPKLGCEVYSDYINYITVFTLTNGQVLDLEGCGQTDYSRARFYSSVGECCSNYDGGQFANEFRELVQFTEFYLKIPEAFEWDNGYFTMSNPYTNNLYPSLMPDTVTNDGNGKDVLFFDLTQYDFEFDAGTLITMFYKLRAKCGVSGFFNGTVTQELHTNYLPLDHDMVAYRSNPISGAFGNANATLTSTPNFTGTDGSASWTGEIASTSTSAGVQDGFIYPHLGDSDIVINELRINGTTVSPDSNGFYPIGDLEALGDAGDTIVFEIDAAYTSCEVDNLKFSYGFDCSSFPTNIIDACIFGDFNVSVEPQSAQIQANVVSPASINMCEPFDAEYSVLNTKNGVLQDVNLTFGLNGTNGQQGYEYVAGSGTITYPAGSTPVSIGPDAEALLLAGGYEVNVSLEQLLPGVFDNQNKLLGLGSSPSNQIDISLQLRSNCAAPNNGRLTLRTFANNVCGDPVKGNSIRVFSDRMPINGIVEPYQAAANLSVNPTGVSCGITTTTLLGNVSIVGGNVTANDSDRAVLIINSPSTYVDGSFATSTQGFILNEVTPTVDGQELRFTLPDGYETINGVDPIDFTIDVALSDAVIDSCGEVENAVIASFNTFVEAPSCGTNICDDLVNTIGDINTLITIEKPSITNLVVGSFNNNKVIGTYDVEDYAVEAGQDIIFELVCASDTSVVVGSQTLSGPISIGTANNFEINYTYTSGTCTNNELIVIARQETSGGIEQCICSDIQSETIKLAEIGGTLFVDGNNDGMLDNTDALIGSVDIIITPTDNTIDLGNGPGVPVTVTTDANGYYSLIVPAGSYDIEVDYTDADFPSDLSQSIDPDNILDGVTNVTVEAGDSSLNNDFGYIGCTVLPSTDGTVEGDTKVGITSLNRNTDRTWVENSKKGFLKLESETLGFVPNRLTTLERDALSSPEEGMLIWNITTQCMEFYDGTMWVCGKNKCLK